MRHGQTVKTYKRSMESGLRAQGLQTSLRHFFQWNAARGRWEHKRRERTPTCHSRGFLNGLRERPGGNIFLFMNPRPLPKGGGLGFEHGMSREAWIVTFRRYSHFPAGQVLIKCESLSRRPVNIPKAFDKRNKKYYNVSWR